ncbi:hypothetical protein WA026_018663, partial [Henosepilachna vigintioctopunctata]
ETCDVVGKLKGDEQDCQKFYQCTHTGWAPMKCEDGLFFNEEISVCDWPKAGSKCGKDTHEDDHSSDGHQGQDDQHKFETCDVVGKLKGDEQDCQKFYQCTHTGWAPMKCKDGLFFNEEILVCDWPKAGTKCGKDTHEDDHSSDGHQGQDDQHKFETCDVVGKLKGDEQDCQKFYQCTHTGWAPMKCKDGLFFNEEILVCDWPKAGTKCGKDTHEDDHSSDGHQGQDDQHKFETCDVVGKLKGDEQDCQKFYQCTHTGWAPMKCKDGLFFNEEILVCDWPKAGTKCGKDTHEDDHSSDGHQGQDDQHKFETCEVVGKLKGDEQDCQKFYQCTHTGWAPMKCKDGLFFNEEILVCDWPKAGTKCGKDTHEDDHSSDGHQGQDDQHKLEACNEVGKLKGDEQDCQKFYQCTHTGWAPLMCKDGLFFNEEISVCDWPKAGTKCGKDTQEHDHSADGHQGQDEQHKFEACNEVGKLKGDEQDCQKFYQCTHTGWAPLMCKDGLFFNEEISVCDWPKAGTKCGKDTQEHDHSADGHQGQDEQHKFEACNEVGKLKGDEQDCQKFYQCTHTGWAPLMCKDGLFFNEEISVCDWPKAGTKCGKDTHEDDHSSDGHQGQDDQHKFETCDVVGKLKGDEQDCQKFYQCTHTGWAPMKCEDGLFFNEEISVCDWPKAGSKCGKDTHEDDHSSDGHQGQDDQHKFETCDVVGKLKGDEQDCQKFYQCTHTGWAPMKCKDGLFFNEEILVCDWPKAGTKCGKDTHEDDHSSDGHQGQDDQHKFETCDVVGKLKGDEQDCQKFYQCTHTGWAPMKCKDGLFFNEEILVCDWPKAGTKCGKDTHEDDHSSDGHQGQDDQHKFETCDVVGKLKGDEQDCQKFYQCTHTGWAPMKCKDGLFFNEEILVCDWPKAGTKCGKDTHEDDHSSDGHQGQDDQHKFETCDVVGKLKGDEQDCQKFYQCTHTGWAPMKCKDGLFFNEEILVCDWPKAGTKCGKDTHEDDHSSDGHQGQDDQHKFETCDVVGKLKGDEQDCQKFYQCTHTGWAPMKCKDGLFFNEEILVCDWPKAGTKCGKDTHEDDHSSDGHQGQDDQHKFETCDVVGKLKGDEQDCQKFYQCTHTGWAPMKCKDGLFFNEEILVCDWPKAGTKCGKDTHEDDHSSDGHQGQDDQHKFETCDVVGKLKGDEQDCQKFYQCTHTGWAPMKCKDGLFFNEEILVCDWPKAGTKCGKDTHEDDHSSDGHQGQDDQHKFETCDVVGKLKGDEQDCQKFYQCTHTGWAPMKCKDGLFFNEEILVCDWPKAGTKCGKDTHEDDHSSDGHQGQDDQHKFETCDVVGKLKGDEQDCQKFYQCTHTGWAPMKCKDGLFFNEEILVCDWPKAGTKCGKDTHEDDHSSDGHQGQDDQHKCECNKIC